jgi:hypothetical protein
MSILFDSGTDRARRTVSAPNYGSSDAYTFMVWFKLISNRGDYSTVFAFGTASPLHMVVQTSSDGLTLVFWNGGAEVGSFLLTVGVWYHIAYVHDASGNVTIYVDGVSRITDTGVGSPSGTAIQFGNDEVYNEYANCEMDYPRCWQAALTGTEVNTDKASNVPVKASPWAYWDWSSATGAGTDQSGNGRDLALTGITDGSSRPTIGPPATISQAGFRGRKDDGSETTATWEASQNMTFSEPLDTAFRLRGLLDTSGDVSSKQIQLEYKLSSDSVYKILRAVFGSPSVTFGADGTAASGTTNCAPSYPSGINADTSKLYCRVTGRSNTANTAPTMPAGWTAVPSADLEDGTGTFGVDTGTRRATYFKKDVVTGAETGTVTVSLSGNSNNTLRACIFRVEVPAGMDITEAVSTGADQSNGTGYSAVGGSSLSWAADDLLCILVAQNIDTGTQSSQSITASGVTFGTRTNRASDAVSNGNDHRHIFDTVPVSSGSGSSAPTYAYTISANGSGPCVFLRLRAVAPAQPVALAPSSNIASGAATSTTAQLTPPSGKTTSDFQASRISDDTNPLPSVDPSTDVYLEPEHCLQFRSAGGASNSQLYDFRYTHAGAALDAYSQSIQISVGSPPASLLPINPAWRSRRLIHF